MPHYDYKCPICEGNSTVYFTFDDIHSVECPKCHVQMNKVFQATPSHFKGTGWAKNDR